MVVSANHPQGEVTVRGCLKLGNAVVPHFLTKKTVNISPILGPKIDASFLLQTDY
jgi:hypothetical protein